MLFIDHGKDKGKMIEISKELRRLRNIEPPLIYVAGKYAGDVDANINKAEDVSVALVRCGWDVFTPHKNTAYYERYTDIPESKWIAMDNNMLMRCDAMYVMNNWRTSPGTKGEIRFADTQHIPTFYEEEYPPGDFSPDDVWMPAEVA